MRSETTYTTTLLLILLDTFGAAPLYEEDTDGSWLPETMSDAFRRSYGVDLPDVNLDKLAAGVMLLTTDYFMQDVTYFINICNVLCGNRLNPQVFDPADAAEILWAITEASLIWPPEENSKSFSPQITAYIGAVLEVEGISNPPDVLRIGLNQAKTSKLTDFADDPEMYNAIYDTQQSKTADLKENLILNLQELYLELKSLPALQKGQTDTILSKIQNMINYHS